jgi:hypothetical protein
MQSYTDSDAPRPTWRATLIDLAILAVSLLVAYASIIFRGETFRVRGMFDWTFLAQPSYVYTGEALARGDFPLWNSNWFAGYPHFAVPSNGTLYPTTILFGLLSFAVAVKLVSLGHVFLFAAFNYWLGRDIFGKRAPALFMGFCGVIGSLVTLSLRGGHLWTVFTLAWMPLAFLLLRRILNSGRAGWAFALSPVLTLMYFAGDPQTMTYVLLLFGSYTAATLAIRLVTRSEPWRAVVVKGLLCLAAVIGGIGLAAVQLLPSQELMAESIRGSGVSYTYFVGTAGWGGQLQSDVGETYTTGLFEQTAPTHFMVPGKVTAALILIAAFGARRREVVALWLAGLFCAFLSHPPEWFFNAILQHVPPFDGMRYSTRILSMLVFLSYLLAAFGLDALLQSTKSTSANRLRWIGGILAALVLLASSLAHDREFISIAVLAVLAFSAIGALVAWRRHAGLGIGALLVAVLVMELAPPFARDVETESDEVLEVTPEYREFSESRSGLDRVHIVRPLNGKIIHGPGVGLLTGDRLIEGAHALYLQRYSDFFYTFSDLRIATSDAEGRIEKQGPYVADWITWDSLTLFDLLNVRYILSFGREVPMMRRVMRQVPGRIRSYKFGKLNVYENLYAMPPLFPVHEIVTTENDELALALLWDSQVDYRRQVTLDDEVEVPPLAPATGIEPIVLRKYGPDEMIADVTLTAPALLVLSEMWYPGWYAQVDDGPARATLRVDTVLQAAPVPAGNHTVRFFYRPSSVLRGLAFTIATAIVWAACLAAYLLRRRKGPEQMETPSSQSL